MLQPVLNTVYKHIACSEELLCSLQFHTDCLAFNQLGLFFFCFRQSHTSIICPVVQNAYA